MTVAWIFPGQGTQSVGMGRDLYVASPAARRVFERADSELGWGLTKLCFEGPDAELTLTAHAQPAIVTVSLAAVEALRDAHPDLPPPVLGAGHSLGEYSALVAAGALEFGDALRLVHLRGRAMQEAVPEGQGAMAAILGGSVEAVTALCSESAAGETLTPANFNAPGQIVIAGSAGAVDRALKLAGERHLKALPLKVSAPFHCGLMQPAADAVRQALSSVRISPFKFPVISNVEATPNSDPERARELLVRQITAPVRWEESVYAMRDRGVSKALEIGPGKVLAGLLKRTAKEIQTLSVGTAGAAAEAWGFLHPAAG